MLLPSGMPRFQNRLHHHCPNMFSPIWTLKQKTTPSTPKLGGTQSKILFVFFTYFWRVTAPLKRNSWNPGGVTNPWAYASNKVP